jgi:hypothetical protein
LPGRKPPGTAHLSPERSRKPEYSSAFRGTSWERHTLHLSAEFQSLPRATPAWFAPDAFFLPSARRRSRFLPGLVWHRRSSSQ